MGRKAKRPRSRKFNGKSYQFEDCAQSLMAKHIQRKLNAAGFKSRKISIPYCKQWNAKAIFSRKRK